MFKIPPSIHLAIGFEETPEAERHVIDILKAYDQAAIFQRDHGDDWLEIWGEWIGQQIGPGPLEYSQARGLWEEVSRVALEFIDDRKKKAETIVCLLFCTEVRPVNFEPSPN